MEVFSFMQKSFLSLLVIVAVSFAIFAGLTCGPSPADIEKIIASPAYKVELEKRINAF